MDTPIRTAAKVQRVLDRQRWKYCFIGGVAVQKWGQPRFTQDVDLTIFTGFGREEAVIDALLALFAPRIRGARSFAIENRVLLLRTADGIDLDVSCGAFPFEESAISRARKVQVIPGVRLRLCTAEDLIVYKAFAGRALDWADVESIIAKQSRGKLDWRHIHTQLKPLAELKEDPQIVPKLKELRRIVELGRERR
jgi:predicted nucleotidyltransferase